MSRPSIPLVDPIANEYLTWCSRDLRESPHTVKRRRTVLRAVERIATPSLATRDQLEAWWSGRTRLATASRINELAVLRHFYRWCQVWEHRADDPTVRITPPRKPAGRPRPATHREWELILAQVDDDPPLRRAVHLGAWAGLRIAETAGLAWTDIDPYTRTARVLGKGNKTRTVKLSRKLIDQLGPDHGGNVVTGTAKAWKPDTLGRKVNAAIHAAVPGDPSLTFHKLRHRYGSLGYQGTKDPKALAEQLGHANVATTLAFYAAAADDAADAIADAVTDD